MDENEEAVLRYVRQHFDPSKDVQVIDVVGVRYIVRRTSNGFSVALEDAPLTKLTGLIVVGVMNRLEETQNSDDPITFDIL